MSFQATDGDMLERAIAGDRTAIEAICKDSARRIENGGLTEKAILFWLAGILERIGKGESPNDAFGWPQEARGRPTERHDWRDWEIRKEVQARMVAGESWNAACIAVCDPGTGLFILGLKPIENICKGLEKRHSFARPGNRLSA